uniref:TPR_REGION domain-containing protein n=1 Tax=Bursaphelenchus xylophilus TaxID=6326 RepID=A0A1I7S1N5_BURXY
MKRLHELALKLERECPEALDHMQTAIQKFPVELDDEKIQKAARREVPGLGRSSGQAEPARRASTGKM